jgi:hypothetical protein
MSVLSSNAVRTGVTFVLSFGLGKGTSFLAALAMPRLMDARVYGGIELGADDRHARRGSRRDGRHLGRHTAATSSTRTRAPNPPLLRKFASAGK